MSASKALEWSPAGITRQRPYDKLLQARQRCTQLVHSWFASALGLEPVSDPRLVLALDVDGVLEDEEEGFSSTGLAGAAALRPPQLGQGGVILHTPRSTSEVWDRATPPRLPGGVRG